MPSQEEIIQKSFRKIKKSEIRKFAELRSVCMMDYPLYAVIYPNEKKRRKQMFYTSWYMLYEYQAFTYIDSTNKMLFSLKKPGDKNTSTLGLLLNPAFFFGAMRYITPACLKRIRSYSKLEEETEKRHYDPKTDYYICNVCIEKNARGGGLFFKVLSAFDEHARYYFVTHSEKNMKLYKLCGGKICEAVNWNGVMHYCMAREASKGLESPPKE